MKLRTPFLTLPMLVALAAILAAYPAPAQTKPLRELALVDTLPRRAEAVKPDSKDLTAYLLVYFKDETHALYFATSADGYTFTDVNGGEPVIRGLNIAEQKGVRDPYITRGPDGAFYLVATDLHIYAKREGLRATDWERPRETYGWGNNRAMVLMKSYDLVHWTHAIVRVDKLFPKLGDVACAWAPEAIYDPAAKRMMVYWTANIKGKGTRLLYSHANEAFTTLETEPKRLLDDSREKIWEIDGDIIEVGGKYHMIYATNDDPKGQHQAIADKVTGPYEPRPGRIDPESTQNEAPNVWRRHGTDTYVLMYDVAFTKPQNMGFSETTDFVNFKNIGRFNEGDSPMKATNFINPKHGAVMSISPMESERLHAWFAKKN